MPTSGGSPVSFISSDSRENVSYREFPQAKFGFVSGLGSANVPADVWPVSNSAAVRKTFLSVATTMWVSSSSASDTAIILNYQYLDEDGRLGFGEYTHTTGQTPTALPGLILDISRVVNAGGIPAVGNIWINTENNHSAGGVPADLTTVQAYIPVGFEQTQQASLMVPAGYYARVTGLEITANRTGGSAGSQILHLVIKNPGKVERVVRRYLLGAPGLSYLPLEGLGRTEALSSISLLVVSVSNNNTAVSASFDFTINPL